MRPGLIQVRHQALDILINRIDERPGDRGEGRRSGPHPAPASFYANSREAASFAARMWRRAVSIRAGQLEDDRLVELVRLVAPPELCFRFEQVVLGLEQSARSRRPRSPYVVSDPAGAVFSEGALLRQRKGR